MRRYYPRPLPAGNIDHLTARYLAASTGTPTFFSGSWKDGKFYEDRGKVHVGAGVTFNGKTVWPW